MEKMISVINENLSSVVSGIKEHKASTEELLLNIKTEMDKKVDIAQEYKNNVEDAKNKITRAELEIGDLEKDLDDLNQKFEGKDFKEILTAGNKEINSKIIEKRKEISVQGRRILDVTEKAHKLKEELIDLKNRRTAAEEDLTKTNTILNYYETNINNMIDFTTYHVDELEGYSIPDYDEEVSDVDINKIADGKIFEEIADISNAEPDEELVEKALNNKEEFDEEFADLINDDYSVDTDSMTDTLESIILTGENIMSSGKYADVIDYSEPEEVEETKVEEPEEEVTEEPVIDEYVEPEPEVDEQFEVEVEPETEEKVEPEVEEVEEEAFDEEQEDETEESEEVENPEDINFDDFLISFDDVNDELKLDEFENTTEEQDNSATDEENIDKYLGNELKVPGFEDEYEDTPPSIEELKTDVLDVTPITEELGSGKREKVVNLLLKTGATKEEIEKYVQDYNSINVDRLKREIENDPEREIADVLVRVMPLKEDVIQKVLELDDDQNRVLKKAAGRRYITMNAFPEIVKENFNVIKNLGVKDPISIIINHPTRFTMNPSNFREILDKYDEEDLIRCLDKNGAVIDKL